MEAKDNQKDRQRRMRHIETNTHTKKRKRKTFKLILQKYKTSRAARK